MRVIAPKDFVTMAWKNGGGITHEVAKSEIGGDVSWRFSIAMVDSDGPFSAFVGLSRILTVLEGNGLVLAGPDKAITVLPLEPVAFPGDMPIVCTRIDGKVRDFNVMFDPLRWAGNITVMNQIKGQMLKADLLAALFLDDGQANGVDVASQCCVICESEEVYINCAGIVLIVDLQART